MGKENVKLSGVSLIVPNVRISSSLEGDYYDDYYFIPSAFPTVKHYYSKLTDGTVVNEGSWLSGEYSFGAVYSDRSDMFLAVGYEFNHDEAGFSVLEHKNRVDLIHRFSAEKIFKHGDTLECGTQIIYAREGSEQDMMNAFSEMSDSTVAGPPENRLQSINKSVIYEFHPWGRLETWPDGDRGDRYPRLESLLPYYKKLGINTFWLLPVSWYPPWVYTVTDHFSVDKNNGTQSELKDLVNSVHENSMKILIDLVVYGCNPESKIIKLI